MDNNNNYSTRPDGEPVYKNNPHDQEGMVNRDIETNESTARENVSASGRVKREGEHEGSGALGYDHSLRELATDFYRKGSDLAAKEMALLREELKEKIDQAKSGMTELGIGGILLFVGVQALLAAAIFALAKVVDPWLSATIVGALFVIVGFIFVGKGKKDVEPNNLAPRKTIKSVKEAKHRFKEEAHGFH